MKLVALSENVLLVLFEQKISHEVFIQVRQCTASIENELSAYIVDIVPAYTSIEILFNIRKTSSEEFKSMVLEAVAKHSVEERQPNQANTLEIPVYYGPEVALDIELLAQHAGLTVEQVIKIHSSVCYDVYATGFAPGFAYLGIVDPCIAMPRKETPRAKISAGSLGIADRQTAVYPTASPGGWQIIGRTAMPMVDYSSERLTPFRTGDKISFIPISKTEYLDMGGELK